MCGSYKRLTYALKQPKNKDGMNSALIKDGYFVSRYPQILTSKEKNDLNTEIASINYFNEGKKNQAAIIQTQFGIQKKNAQFVIYPCENASPFDVPYEVLIEPRELLSGFVVKVVNQLINIDEFDPYEGMLLSLVLLRYSRYSSEFNLPPIYLAPHKDDYIFNFMGTLACKNMIGTNGIYDTNAHGMPGNKVEFSDRYYKIVDNRYIFHDVKVEVINQNSKKDENNSELNSRNVLIVGVKNRFFCKTWTIKPPFMRSDDELLPVGGLTKVMRK